MRGSGGGPGSDGLAAALDRLAGTDLTPLPGEVLREQLRELVTAHHRVYAELLRRVDVFDRRQLAAPDGFRTTKGWLRAFTGLAGATAHRLVKTARVLRELPKLTSAAASGQVSSEHLQHVARLVDQVGPAAAAAVEPTLADAAVQLDADQFVTVCARVRAHVDPDGTDPAAGFETRGLTLAPVAGMMTVRGQLDPEGGAALAVALDSLMCPPSDGDDRSPAQRRADALVELARRPLAAGSLPTVGGQRPQVGVLLYPQALSPRTLAALAQAQGEALTAGRLRDFIGDTAVWGGTAEPGRITRADLTTAGEACPPGAFPPGGGLGGEEVHPGRHTGPVRSSRRVARPWLHDRAAKLDPAGLGRPALVELARSSGTRSSAADRLRRRRLPADHRSRHQHAAGRGPGPPARSLLDPSCAVRPGSGLPLDRLHHTGRVDRCPRAP